MAASVQYFMLSNGVDWNTVLTYALMGIGKAERTFFTIKNAIKKSEVENG